MNERDTHTLKANPYGSAGDVEVDKQQTGNRHGHRDSYLYAKAQGDAVITVSDASGITRLPAPSPSSATPLISFSARRGGGAAGLLLPSLQTAKPVQHRVGKLSALHQRTDSGHPAGYLYYQYKSEGDTGKGRGHRNNIMPIRLWGRCPLGAVFLCRSRISAELPVIHYTGYAKGAPFSRDD